MIPRTDLTPTMPSTIPSCSLPKSGEVSEEGFGYFRGTWFMGRALLADAQAVVEEEAEILEWLDQAADNPDAFDVLANAIEDQYADDVPQALDRSEPPAGLESFIGNGQDVAPLGGLEVGVAGLCHALSVAGCLTAASCRSHATSQSWSDCPVVFFAAPTWRVELLVDLISAENCGLEEDRGMLKIYAASVRQTHRLAERILLDRGCFRKMPDRWRPRRRRSRSSAGSQLGLTVDAWGESEGRRMIRAGVPAASEQEGGAGHLESQ